MGTATLHAPIRPSPFRAGCTTYLPSIESRDWAGYRYVLDDSLRSICIQQSWLGIMATRTEKKDALESVACKRSNPLGIGERHGRKRAPFPRGRGPSPTRKKEDEIRPGARKEDS